MVSNFSRVPNSLLHRIRNRVERRKSSPFQFQGDECFLEDNGDGDLNIVKNVLNSQDPEHEIVTKVGTVDYAAGLIIIENFAVSQVYGGNLKISVTPKDSDVEAQKRSILRVLDEDINVTVQQVRI